MKKIFNKIHDWALRNGPIQFVVPTVFGLVIWGLCVAAAWQGEIWNYWHIGFYQLVFLTFGLHALLIAILLSIIMGIGRLADGRGKPSFNYLLPIIIGSLLLAVVPYDVNSVARDGIAGILAIPLFWMVIASALYLHLLNRGAPTE